jgi:superoxide reductase
MNVVSNLYRCDICETIVEVLDEHSMDLTCCGRQMRPAVHLLGARGSHRHVPLVVRCGERLHVRVGALPHPMREDHRVEWVELVTSDSATRRFLEPDQPPQCDFVIEGEPLTVRCCCNCHGIWQTALSKPEPSTGQRVGTTLQLASGQQASA